MTLEEFGPGQNVFNHGETGNKFYIILEGKVAVLIPDKVKVPPEVTATRTADAENLKCVIKRITLRIERL